MREDGRPARGRGTVREKGKSSLAFDAASEARRIAGFIRKTVKGAEAEGVVVGLSGGVDSSVVSALCARALGRRRVLGVLMPSASTPRADMHDAESLAQSLGIETTESGVDGAVAGLLGSLGIEGTRIARANLQARARMTVLYFHSNSLGRLVAGTGDRSEILLGFFTKYGDGGADLLPIAHLYKTQVRALAEHLGLPGAISRKPASPQLWPGHRATDEIPADYEVLDPVLHFLYDEGLSPRAAARRAGVSDSIVAEVVRMHTKSAHKRSPPASLEVRGRGS